ncbi:MAG: hypothetical protein AAGD32_10010 [Planctomycetota bacterium]
MKVLISCAAVTLIATPALAAQRLVASTPGADVTIDAPSVSVVDVPFTATETISGVGVTAQWFPLSGDFDGGTFPFSMEVAADVVSPDGQTIAWGINEGPPIAGEMSIADYPFADVQDGFVDAVGTGSFSFQWFDAGNTPGISQLTDVTYHLLTDAPDVVTTLTSDVSSGPQWDRPFSIVGVSGLGPTFFDVVPFSPEVSGGYIFDSTVSDGDGFTFLYEGSFDPTDPTANLLDLGLGNGFASNGAADGQSIIEALLFEDTDYFFVTSQFAASSGPQSYVTTVTGPGLIPEPTVLGPLAIGLLALRRRR